jgi:ATPase complex subunit ATP10
MAGNIMKNSTTRHVSALWSYCLLAGMLLIFSCKPYGEQGKTPAKEKQQPARTNTMTEKTNPNIGIKFPEVKDDSLANTRVSLPDAARGKVTLIAVAFLRESQSQLDSWLEPFGEKFGNKTEFTFYEVPMLAGDYKAMRPMIDGGMRAGIPQEKHEHVVTMYGDVEKYIKALNLDLRMGYAFLLDREGIIRFQGQGFATPETLKELFETAEKLAK